MRARDILFGPEKLRALWRIVLFLVLAVGALWALYRAEVEGKPVEEAIADGKAAGLTKLEPAVREILGAR